MTTARELLIAERTRHAAWLAGDWSSRTASGQNAAARHRAALAAIDAELGATTRPPLVLVDITEGVYQTAWTFSGTGAPELRVYDFDRDGMDDDRRADMIAEAETWARLMRERAHDAVLELPEYHDGGVWIMVPAEPRRAYLAAIDDAVRFEELAQEWREDRERDLREREEERRVEQLREDRIAEAAERAGMAPGELTELFGR